MSNEKFRYLLLERSGRYVSELYLTKEEAKKARWAYVAKERQLIKMAG